MRWLKFLQSLENIHELSACVSPATVKRDAKKWHKTVICNVAVTLHGAVITLQDPERYVASSARAVFEQHGLPAGGPSYKYPHVGLVGSSTARLIEDLEPGFVQIDQLARNYFFAQQLYQRRPGFGDFHSPVPHRCSLDLDRNTSKLAFLPVEWSSIHELCGKHVRQETRACYALGNHLGRRGGNCDCRAFIFEAFAFSTRSEERR